MKYIQLFNRNIILCHPQATLQWNIVCKQNLKSILHKNCAFYESIEIEIEIFVTTLAPLRNNFGYRCFGLNRAKIMPETMVLFSHQGLWVPGISFDGYAIIMTNQVINKN